MYYVVYDFAKPVKYGERIVDWEWETKSVSFTSYADACRHAELLEKETFYSNVHIMGH